MRRHAPDERIEAGLFRRPAVTIGVFDGVHRGHQKILGRLREEAEARGGTAVVVTFERHPQAILSGAEPLFIMSLPHRLLMFERLGIDDVVVLRFDEAMRQRPAREFLEEFLVKRLGAEVLVLGYDAAFGKNARKEVVDQAARDVGIRLVRVDAERREGEPPISSSFIREAILTGDLDRAAAMLGRAVSVYGTVVRGEQRGRELGFPTANLDLHHEIRPPRGVYACRVTLDGAVWPAMANIGCRPTFETVDGRELVEVHVIGYEGDLYGRPVEVEFVRRLRDERPFPSGEALARQLGDDRRAALEALASVASPDASPPKDPRETLRP